VGVASIWQALFASKAYVFLPFVGIVNAGILLVWGWGYRKAWALALGTVSLVLCLIGAVLTIVAVA
jgi:hypothetical protein